MLLSGAVLSFTSISLDYAGGWNGGTAVDLARLQTCNAIFFNINNNNNSLYVLETDL